MFTRFLTVAGASDRDDPRDEHLWLLIGPKEYCDAGRCFYLSLSDRIKTVEDLITARNQAVAAGYPDVTEGEIFEALTVYRRASLDRKLDDR